MKNGVFRAIASLATLAWLVSAGQPVAIAVHVASDHAHAARHVGTSPSGLDAWSHFHPSGDADHSHGLTEAMPGVRGGTRQLTSISPVAADAVSPARVGGPAVPCRAVPRAAPEPPPPESPTVRRL